ncbi:rluD, partial [Symbiodinium pilosum]
MDNRGILRLCTFLEEQEIKVYEMNFSDNAIDDDGLYRLAQYITSEMAPVHALYMSANQISMQGVVRLLTMLSLHPMYPVEFDRGGKAAFLPLWLQLDNNMIENDHLQDFLDHQLSMLGCAVVLHLCLRSKDEPPLDESMLQAGMAPAGLSTSKIFEEHRRLTSRMNWLQKEPSSAGVVAERVQRDEPRFLYEDAHFLVMLKPAGWHCGNELHAAGTGRNLAMQVPKMTSDKRKDLGKQLLKYGEAQALHDYIILRFGADEAMKKVMNADKLYGMVHRLDVGTSGPLLIAKGLEGFFWAKQKIAAQELQRDYVALVHGTFGRDARGEYGPTGIIQAPVDKSRYEITRRCEIHANGQPASTLYERIAEYESPNRKARYTLLHCRLLTGRTHQIRVHLEHIGMPLVGDRSYQRHRKTFDTALTLDRTFLHK